IIDSAMNGHYYPDFFPNPAMALGKDGSVYVTGYKRILGTMNDGFLLKYDKDGNTSWKKDLDSGSYSPSYWMSASLALDKDENVYVANPVGNLFESAPG